MRLLSWMPMEIKLMAKKLSNNLKQIIKNVPHFGGTFLFSYRTDYVLITNLKPLVQKCKLALYLLYPFQGIYYGFIGSDIKEDQ